MSKPLPGQKLADGTSTVHDFIVKLESSAKRLLNDANKKAIADAGGVPPLVDLARAGTPRQKEQAAAALANLTVDPDNRSRVVGAGGIAALVPLMSGGETERQRSFAHACLSNLAVDEMIKAKILVTARSGEETARAQALAEACRNKLTIGEGDAVGEGDAAGGGDEHG